MAEQGTATNLSGPKKVEVEIPNFPIHSVVVYPDRAEVTRLVELRLEAGEAEVVLKSLSKSLDKDSVRVDGVGPGSITEVSFQELAVSKEEHDAAIKSASEANREVADLEEEIKEKNDTLSSLALKKERLHDQEKHLNEYAEKLFEAGKEAKNTDLISEQTIGGVLSFLDTYEEKKLEISKALCELASEVKVEKAALDKLNKRKRDLKPVEPVSPDSPPKQQVIGILLSMKEEGSIRLLVSYVVLNAAWLPRYDLRVSSADRRMHVSYFGMVKQNTGEDWINTNLSLSTAAPSIGGCAPKLETAKISLTQYDPKPLPADGLSEIGETVVSEGLSSSVFPITSTANIPADNSGHKVCIGAVDLKPTFEYNTVPKLAQHAFLRATARNDSEFPFLPGPANVYLDHSYVTQTSLEAVSPNEEFSCSLGVDPSVKVVYKPIRRYCEETGILSRNFTITYTQVTEITNTRGEVAVVTFTDQVPKSQNKKLKVTLLDPVIPKQKTGAPPTNPKMNTRHNVEWRLELQKGESRSVTIQYRVEYPAKRKVEGL